MIKISSFVDNISNILGDNWIQLSEPETVSLLIQKSGVDFNPQEMDVLNVIKTLLTSSTPWEDPFVFENVIDALTGRPVMPDTLTKPPLEYICSGVQTMREIDNSRELSDDIRRYIASVAQYEQLLLLPPPLDICNKFLPEDPSGYREKIDFLMPLLLDPNYTIPDNTEPILATQIMKVKRVLSLFH